MAFPVLINPSAPADSDNPGLGDDEFRALKQQILDLFGIPASTNITAAIMSLGALLDGKVALDTVVKGSSPFKRLIGTEASGKDTRLVETGGFVKIQVNTNTEASPTWADVFSASLSTKAAAFAAAVEVATSLTALTSVITPLLTLNGAGGLQTDGKTSGSVVFAAAGIQTVALSAAQPDSLYKVLVSPKTDGVSASPSRLWTENYQTTSFDIGTSGGIGTIAWLLFR